MSTINSNDTEPQSLDLVAENIAKLKALFPDIVTKGQAGTAINVDVLKQLVWDKTVTDAEEKYGLDWHGKRRARQLALTPSTGTLRPCPEESVDWDTTQNLMIEGDKLGKPRNIAELTKERLRRAAKKIKEENPMFSGDLGFRVFKLDSINIREWEPKRDDLPRTLEESVEHIKTERSEAGLALFATKWDVL